MRPAAPEGARRGVLPVVDETGPSCVTCGDVAVEVTVARLLPDRMAVADTGHGEEEISVALVDVEAGGIVLVHAGEAIAVVRR